MNTTEAEYAAELERQKRAGEIIRYDFEPEKFRLAKLTYYTPDFRVQLTDGTVQFRELKGVWTDDARVKIKVCAEKHDLYQFVVVKKLPKKDGGGFGIVEVF